MLGGDGRERPNRQVVPLQALRGLSALGLSMLPLLLEQIGVIYPSLLNQSGVPFAVRLLLVQLPKLRNQPGRGRSGVLFAVRLLPALMPRMFLLPMPAPLPVPSPRRPFEVPLGSDAERGVPVTVRLLSKIAKVNPS